MEANELRGIRSVVVSEAVISAAVISEAVISEAVSVVVSDKRSNMSRMR